MNQRYIKESSSSKRAASPSLDVPPPKRKLPWLMSQATSHTMSRHSSQEQDSAREASKAPALNFYTPQRMIEVIVLDDATVLFANPNKQTFTIHYNVLAHYSPHFQNILEADPKSHKVAIYGCHTAFGLLQNWLYTQKIQGPHGAIKLMEYAKMWRLAKELGIARLERKLVNLIETTSPSTNEDVGNTLKDFQHFVYHKKHSNLQDEAITKTFAAMKWGKNNRIQKDMPDAMKEPFMLAMMMECVRLPAWNKGQGFDGVKETMSQTQAQGSGVSRRAQRESSRGSSSSRSKGDHDREGYLWQMYKSNLVLDDSDDDVVSETEVADFEEDNSTTDDPNSEVADEFFYEGEVTDTVAGYKFEGLTPPKHPTRTGL